MTAHPLVHVELHTGDERGASAFYTTLLRWRPERIHAGCASYLALDTGSDVGGGIVECDTERAFWLPYVGVGDVDVMTDRAVALGAIVALALPGRRPAPEPLPVRPSPAFESAGGS